jgi:ArsR family transcriptional regulator
MEYFLKLFKALSDPTRLRIVYLLINAKSELCICELMEALNIPQYNISKHMKELKHAGLVKERKEGRFVFYTLIECCGEFSENVLKAVKAVDHKQLNADLKRLKKKAFRATCKSCC